MDRVAISLHLITIALLLYLTFFKIDVVSNSSLEIPQQYISEIEKKLTRMDGVATILENKVIVLETLMKTKANDKNKSFQKIRKIMSKPLYESAADSLSITKELYLLDSILNPNQK
jgi:hypothetical protein